MNNTNYSFTITAQNSSDYIVEGNDQNGNVSGNDPSISVKVDDTLNLDINASGHPLFLIISSVIFFALSDINVLAQSMLSAMPGGLCKEDFLKLLINITTCEAIFSSISGIFFWIIFISSFLEGKSTQWYKQRLLNYKLIAHQSIPAAAALLWLQE